MTHASTTAASSTASTRFPRPKPAQIVAAVAAALVFLLILLLLLFQWDWLRGPISRFASARTHRAVRIDGHLRVHLLTWTPSVTVEGLKVGEPAWAPPGDMAQVGAITAKVRLLPLFGGRVDVPLFEIDKPDIVLIQDASGRANWDFTPAPQKTPGKPLKLPPIEKFVIADGRLRATIAPRHLQFAGTVNSAERNTGSNAETFHMGGKGELNNKPFRVDIAGGPLLNIHRDQPYPFHVDLRGGETHFLANGRILHPFDFGQIEAALSLEGRDLNEVYYLTGLALPNTPPYRLTGDLVRNEKLYKISHLTGRVGGSDLEGGLNVDTGRPRVLLSGALASRRLDFKDLAFLFGGGAGRTAPAQTTAWGAGAGAPGPPKPPGGAGAGVLAARATRLLPDATLQTDRLRKMDADVTYRAASVLAPKLPLRGVEFGIKLDDGLLTLDPVRFAFPQGALDGHVRLDARHATPITDLDMRLSNIRMENFIPATPGAPKPLEGTLQARARLHGVGDSVHRAASTASGEVTAVIPHGQIRQAFAELLGIAATKGLFQLLNKDQHQTDIRCAVADFRVQHGVLTADQIVVDTGVVNVKGGGTVDLSDETLNLAFKGEPKSFRLVHLSTPITIGGHLASPAFGRTPGGASAQGGAARALAALVNPLLVILPFIDPGLGKNADCAALYRDAKASPASVTAKTAPRAPHPRG